MLTYVVLGAQSPGGAMNGDDGSRLLGAEPRTRTMVNIVKTKAKNFPQGAPGSNSITTYLSSKSDVFTLS